MWVRVRVRVMVRVRVGVGVMGDGDGDGDGDGGVEGEGHRDPSVGRQRTLPCLSRRRPAEAPSRVCLGLAA